MSSLVSTITDETTLLSNLQELSPHSIPLLRRLQSGPRTAHTIVLSSSLEDLPWTAACIDRSRAPGTECWLFSSAEAAPSDPTPEAEQILRSQLLSIVAHVDPETDHGAPSLLIGSVHARLQAILASTPSLGVRTSPFYTKHVLPSQPFTPLNPDADTALPSHPNLYFSAVEERDYPKVMAVNAIVRHAKMIRGLPSVAVRVRGDAGSSSGGSSQNSKGGSSSIGNSAEEPEAIAFCFLDMDASVRTVHVDEAWRRRGLARAMVERLLRLNRDALVALDASGAGWVTGDVEAANGASTALFAGLGGEAMSQVAWLWVDVGDARRLVQA